MVGHHGSQGSFKAAWAMSLDGDSLLRASGTHLYVWEALKLTMLNNEPEFSQFTFKAKRFLQLVHNGTEGIQQSIEPENGVMILSRSCY